MRQSLTGTAAQEPSLKWTPMKSRRVYGPRVWPSGGDQGLPVTRLMSSWQQTRRLRAKRRDELLQHYITISAGISQARSRLYPRRVGRVLRGPPERGIERGVHMPPFLWPPALDLTGMPSPRPGTGSANCSTHQRRKCGLVEPSPDPHVRGTRPSPVYKLFCPESHLSSPLTLILTTITQPLLLGILLFPRVRLYRSPLPQRQRYTSPSRTLGKAP